MSNFKIGDKVKLKFLHNSLEFYNKYKSNRMMGWSYQEYIGSLYPLKNKTLTILEIYGNRTYKLDDSYYLGRSGGYYYCKQELEKVVDLKTKFKYILNI